ncbi:putative damage-inducible protein DinB [Algoriphagus ratkowskyi]|uniref:DinB family protein n=1 Tax=Algoriphagus ratkowskyi TaxID=57028 RepID=A0A2W7RYW4_9BACT|nr:DinB family protein [Algoriphagus ratkowskyi]PZX59799.1 putative damage-inducible protein DinB [Algoriphagus ratkowskyi]TXD78491.1 DinB family protein [Algoriphagus ratkowskyi]
MKKALKFLSSGLLMAFIMMASTAVSAQTTKDEFLSKWQNSKQFTLDVLDKMPDSGMEYKTDPAAMSFKEQIHHIGNAIVGISQGFLKGGDPGFTIDLTSASKADLASYIAKCYDYGTTTMKALSDADAGESIEVFGTNVTRRQVMALIMDHSTHHRGSAIAYLRVEGAEPPAFVGF